MCFKLEAKDEVVISKRQSGYDESLLNMKQLSLQAKIVLLEEETLSLFLFYLFGVSFIKIIQMQKTTLTGLKNTRFGFRRVDLSNT